MDKQGRWVTINGAHVFIKDGETPTFNGQLQKTVKPENQYGNKEKYIEDWKPSTDISDKPTEVILNTLFNYSQRNKGLDFRRMLTNELRGNGQLSKKTEFNLGQWTYKKTGNGWDAYREGKHIWTGTNASLADAIASHFNVKQDPAV